MVNFRKPLYNVRKPPSTNQQTLKRFVEASFMKKCLKSIAIKIDLSHTESTKQASELDYHKCQQLSGQTFRREANKQFSVHFLTFSASASHSSFS